MSEWIVWRGVGAMPVDAGTMIEVTHRDGGSYTEPAGEHRSRSWSHLGGHGDIVRYRLVGEKPAAGVTAKPDPLKPALERQEGGGHYKAMAIQPVEYIHQNRLTYLEGNVVKYVSRHASKGKAEDVRKAIHYCQLILKLQYGLDG